MDTNAVNCWSVIESMPKSKAKPYYHELKAALQEPGCPFCRLLARSADRYLDAVLWEMVNDSRLRSELNQARGYCQAHGWLLVRAGAALGVAILMNDVVRTLLEVLEANPVKSEAESVFQGLLLSLEKGRAAKSTAELVAALSPQTPCPVCAHLQTIEAHIVDTLWIHLEGPQALAELYRESGGLCLPHLRETLAHAPSTSSSNVLIAAQRSIWQRLHSELTEFIRKNDQRFRDEPFGSERDSWRRALEAISGAPPRDQSERRGLTASR